jgi:hypothetical protein
MGLFDSLRSLKVEFCILHERRILSHRGDGVGFGGFVCRNGGGGEVKAGFRSGIEGRSVCLVMGD